MNIRSLAKRLVLEFPNDADKILLIQLIAESIDDMDAARRIEELCAQELMP